jgi:hypothetical protein
MKSSFSVFVFYLFLSAKRKEETTSNCEEQEQEQQQNIYNYRVLHSRVWRESEQNTKQKVFFYFCFLIMKKVL